MANHRPLLSSSLRNPCHRSCNCAPSATCNQDSELHDGDICIRSKFLVGSGVVVTGTLAAGRGRGFGHSQYVVVAAFVLTAACVLKRPDLLSGPSALALKIIAHG